MDVSGGGQCRRRSGDFQGDGSGVRSLGAALSRSPPPSGGKPGPTVSSLRGGPVFPLPAQAAASLAEAGRPFGLRGPRPAPLRLSPHSGHWSTSGTLSPGRGPSQALGAGRRPTQSRPLRNPSLCSPPPRPAASRRSHPLAEAARSPRPFTLLAVAVISSPSPWPRDACLAAYPAFKGIPRQLMVLMLL